MASIVLYVELAPYESAYTGSTVGVNIVNIRRTQPKRANPDTRWVAVRVGFEEAGDLFDSPQEYGPFGVSMPLIEAEWSGEE